MLTGTPAFARPKEMYNMLSMIRPDVFDDFKKFGYRYCDPRMASFARVMEYNGATNTKELHYMLKNGIMIRRLKKEVLKDLPDKTRIKQDIEMNKKLQSFINKELSDIKDKVGNGGLENMLGGMSENIFNTYCDNTASSSEKKFGQDERNAMFKQLTYCYR